MYVDEVEIKSPYIGQEVQLFSVHNGGTPYRPNFTVVACLPGHKPASKGFAFPWAGTHRIDCIHGDRVGVKTGFALFPFD